LERCLGETGNKTIRIAPKSAILFLCVYGMFSPAKTQNCRIDKTSLKKLFEKTDYHDVKEQIDNSELLLFGL
jgi:hypothetical protein